MKKPRFAYMVRLVRSDDAEQYFKLVSANRHQLSDFFAETLNSTLSVADTLVYLAGCIRKAEDGIQYLFVIEDLEQGLIGSLEVRHIDPRKSSGEIGFFIDRFDLHSLIVIRSLNMVTDFCFSYCRLNRLLYRTPAVNTQARKAAESNGFILSATTTSGAKSFLSPPDSIVQYYLINAIH